MPVSYDFDHPVDRPQWDWSLIDFDSGDFIGALNDIKSRSLSPARNAGGSCAFEIPLDDDMAYYADNLATFVRCERNGEIEWEGKVYNIKKMAKANKMSINCLGWFEELNHRSTVTDLLFSTMSIGQIAWSLVAHTILQDGPIGFVAGPTQVAGFTMDAYKLAADLGIASEIQKLTEVENGIDFEFDYVNRHFKFVNHIGVDKPEAHFGFKAGPENLDDCTETTEGTRICTRMKAIHPISKNFVITDHPTAVIQRGVYREVKVLTGLRTTTVEEEQQALAAYGAAETAIRGNPIKTYDMTVLPPGPNVDIIRPYDDFNVGDTMRLSVNQGAFQADQQVVRCYGFTINIGDNGEERLSSISLQT